MSSHDQDRCLHPRSGCCSAGDADGAFLRGLSRRGFLGGMGVAAGGLALGAFSTRALRAEESPRPARLPLRVKPVLLYSTYTPQKQTSWRPWGGIQIQRDVDEEVARIRGELEKLKAEADFPVEFLPIASIRNSAEAKGLDDLKDSDTIIVYAAGGDTLDGFVGLGKDVIVFCRYRSGPVYLWYEIVSPRFLRQHTDRQVVKGIDPKDVVIDSQQEILWRLRALCGLKNTRGKRIVALGGASGWACPDAPKFARDRFGLDIQSVSYDDLAKLVKAAKTDAGAVATARQRAAEYLAAGGVTLETGKVYVENAFLLEAVFRELMHAAGAQTFTINSCMGTIMPIAETTACLALTILNDAGYQAYCESDFVVIPSGILLAGISGRPVFLNDPTYPADGIITLAHCTAPRMLDGKTLDPARIMTHFESDYGAAPKVEMRKGQIVTNILPDFKAEKWIGLGGEIVDAPFFPICRSQIDVQFKCSSDLVAEKMPGFHWMTVYGDYSKEVAYALKRTNVAWEYLG